jgi:hypothetical protein
MCPSLQVVPDLHGAPKDSFEGSRSPSNQANRVQPATASDPVLPAASSTEPCRFRFPDPVYEQTGPSPVQPFDFNALFVKWSIDHGVADAYIERYSSKHKYLQTTLRRQNPTLTTILPFLNMLKPNLTYAMQKNSKNIQDNFVNTKTTFPKNFRRGPRNRSWHDDCMDFESRGH